MKNIFTLILFFSVVAYGKAQTLPNNNFETWEVLGSFEEPESWNSANPFTALAGGVGVTKTEESFSGTYAARLETIELMGGAFQAPGLLTLSEFEVDIVTQEFNFSGGYFLQENVAKLTGMYKYSGVDGDSASVVIYNFRHPEGEEIDTIGTGITFLHDTEEWTPFEVIMENNNDHLPDTFNVMIISSGSEEMKTGSMLVVDSIVIETNTGIIDLWNPVLPLNVYPNPAVDFVNFEADGAARERVLNIYDLNGRLVRQVDFTGKSFQLNINNFEAGLFSYSVFEKGKRVFGGSFLKK